MLNKTRLKSTRNKKLPSIAGTDGSDGLMVGESLPLQHIIDNPLNVQGDDCPAAFVGFQEEAVVGVAFPELVAGEPERSGLVQAIGKPITGRLPFTCVAGPAADVHPLLAIADSIGVDGDQADIAFAQLPAPGVDALGACPEGDIVFIRSDQGEAYCICKGEDAVIVRITSLAHPLPSSSSQNWSIFSIILSAANRYYRAADS